MYTVAHVCVYSHSDLRIYLLISVCMFRLYLCSAKPRGGGQNSVRSSGEKFSKRDLSTLKVTLKSDRATFTVKDACSPHFCEFLYNVKTNRLLLLCTELTEK